MIDGFPRNKENLDGWLKFFGDSAEILAVLSLECPQEKCTERINFRSKNSGRIDDNSDSLRKRFDVFFVETIENYKHLEKITRVIKIKADIERDEVFKFIVNELDIIFK